VGDGWESDRGRWAAGEKEFFAGLLVGMLQKKEVPIKVPRGTKCGEQKQLGGKRFS